MPAAKKPQRVQYDYLYRDHPVHKAFKSLWDERPEGVSQTVLADAIGKHQTEVSKWLLGVRLPDFYDVAAIEQALQVQRGTIYLRAGLVDAEESDSLPVVLSDPSLSKEARQLIAKIIENDREQQRTSPRRKAPARR